MPKHLRLSHLTLLAATITTSSCSGDTAVLVGTRCSGLQELHAGRALRWVTSPTLPSTPSTARGGDAPRGSGVMSARGSRHRGWGAQHWGGIPALLLPTPPLSPFPEPRTWWCVSCSTLSPFTSTTRSPARSPAASAGEPGSTLRMNCPLLPFSPCRWKPYPSGPFSMQHSRGAAGPGGALLMASTTPDPRPSRLRAPAPGGCFYSAGRGPRGAVQLEREGAGPVPNKEGDWAGLCK